LDGAVVETVGGFTATVVDGTGAVVVVTAG